MQILFQNKSFFLWYPAYYSNTVDGSLREDNSKDIGFLKLAKKFLEISYFLSCKLLVNFTASGATK